MAEIIKAFNSNEEIQKYVFHQIEDLNAKKQALSVFYFTRHSRESFFFARYSAPYFFAGVQDLIACTHVFLKNNKHVLKSKKMMKYINNIPPKNTSINKFWCEIKTVMNIYQVYIKYLKILNLWNVRYFVEADKENFMRRKGEPVIDLRRKD